jgi:hypothetical protein
LNFLFRSAILAYLWSVPFCWVHSSTVLLLINSGDFLPSVLLRTLNSLWMIGSFSILDRFSSWVNDCLKLLPDYPCFSFSLRLFSISLIIFLIAILLRSSLLSLCSLLDLLCELGDICEVFLMNYLKKIRWHLSLLCSFYIPLSLNYIIISIMTSALFPQKLRKKPSLSVISSEYILSYLTKMILILISFIIINHLAILISVNRAYVFMKSNFEIFAKKTQILSYPFLLSLKVIWDINNILSLSNQSFCVDCIHFQDIMKLSVKI